MGGRIRGTSLGNTCANLKWRQVQLAQADAKSRVANARKLWPKCNSSCKQCRENCTLLLSLRIALENTNEHTLVGCSVSAAPPQPSNDHTDITIVISPQLAPVACPAAERRKCAKGQIRPTREGCFGCPRYRHTNTYTQTRMAWRHCTYTRAHTCHARMHMRNAARKKSVNQFRYVNFWLCGKVKA